MRKTWLTVVGSFREILRAGQSPSPAFTSYLDFATVERAGVLEARLEESDNEALLERGRADFNA